MVDERDDGAYERVAVAKVLFLVVMEVGIEDDVLDRLGLRMDLGMDEEGGFFRFEPRNRGGDISEIRPSPGGKAEDRPGTGKREVFVKLRTT